MALTLIILYLIFAGFVFLYSFIQLSLVVNYHRYNKKFYKEIPSVDKQFEPFVTIQLPIYNEMYVIERLIDAVCEFDYPKEKFEIQILDDSNDETVEIVAHKVKQYQSLGYNIQQIRRPIRSGFKAGALEYGLEESKGEFIAIFDADFVPRKDFLRKTLIHFKNRKIGVVQTKWEHLNRDYSIITKLQAFALDAHFTIEQGGRNYGHHFINFNGTAGVWRKNCIQDAGGWQADTLTEDLDLSYRAQLKGWEFVYREDIESPAELPVEMNALKSQQFRWTKGAAECTRKNLSKVLLKRDYPLSTKLHAIFHLMNSFLFVCVLSIALLTVPMLLIKESLFEYKYLLGMSAIFLVGFMLLSYFYWASYSRFKKNKLLALIKFICLFPLFLAMSMGLSLHNAIAVMEGYLGKKSPFIRTPKFNITKRGTFKEKKYNLKRINPLIILEMSLFVYFIYGLYISIFEANFLFFPILFLLVIGYGAVGFLSLKHTVMIRG